MIKNIFPLLILAGVFLFWGKSLYARFDTNALELQTNGPIVLELFTSQSCYSCPPADKILTEAAQNPDIITLGFHVTYWNHLHWKDTLSRAFSSTRQRSYANYQSSRRVYTPQMIINGKTEFVGSHINVLRKEAPKAQPVKLLDIVKNENTLVLNLPDLPENDYTIWMFGTKSAHTENIPSGENRGKRIQ